MLPVADYFGRLGHTSRRAKIAGAATLKAVATSERSGVMIA
jgi:hypothetical protein